MPKAIWKEPRSLKPDAKATFVSPLNLGSILKLRLRRSLRTVLPVDKSKSWMRYSGMVASGDPESSRSIDDVVYGHKN